MVTPDIEPLAHSRMSETEIDRFLTRQGIGILALARANDAYSVPLSFGYDGDDRLYFVFLQGAPASRKAEFAAATERASFSAYEVASRDDWESVHVEGPLAEVGDENWDDLVAAIEDNAWYPSLFRESEPMADFRGYALLAEEVTGLRGDAGGREVGDGRADDADAT